MFIAFAILQATTARGAPPASARTRHSRSQPVPLRAVHAVGGSGSECMSVSDGPVSPAGSGSAGGGTPRVAAMRAAVARAWLPPAAWSAARASGSGNPAAATHRCTDASSAAAVAAAAVALMIWMTSATVWHDSPVAGLW